MKSIRLFIVFGVASIGSLVLAACQPQIVEVVKEVPVEQIVEKIVEVEVEPEPVEPEGPKTLLVGVPDDAATFDMLFATTPRSTAVIMNTYETLMTYELQDAGGGLRRWDTDNVTGAVLETMSVADDGVTWTLKVREGIQFPSGETINAETVKFMFDRNFGVEGSGGGFMYSFVGRIPGTDAVEVVDEYTLQVTTDAPNPLLQRILVLSNSTPLDPSLVTANSSGDENWAETWVQQNTAGAGPYQLQSWTPGVEIVLQANENYWRGKPPIEVVIMKVIPTAADRMMLLAAGTLDMVEKLSAEEIDAVGRMSDLKVISIPSTNGVQLIMHNGLEPFDNLQVRQAISYAFPYAEIIENVYFGRAQTTAGPIPVGFPDHNSGDYPYEQNLELARELLAAAGYADGFSVDLEMDSGNPDHEAIAVLAKAALQEIGVDVTIRKLTPAVFAEQRATLGLKFFLNESLWWVDDPSYPLMLGYTSGAFFNYGAYSNESVDEMIMASLTELDPDVRSELLEDIQGIIIEEAPMVWIAQPNFNLASRPEVSGYAHFNDHMVRFQFIDKE